MNRTLAASIAAREQYLAALRRHEQDLEDKLAAGRYDYEVGGVIRRLRRAIMKEAIA